VTTRIHHWFTSWDRHISATDFHPETDISPPPIANLRQTYLRHWLPTWDRHISATDCHPQTDISPPLIAMLRQTYLRHWLPTWDRHISATDCHPQTDISPPLIAMLRQTYLRHWLPSSDRHISATNYHAETDISKKMTPVMWQHVVCSTTLIHPRRTVTAGPCVGTPVQVYRTIGRYIPQEAELHKHGQQHPRSQPGKCHLHFPIYN
jgi:hypothetical protein